IKFFLSSCQNAVFVYKLAIFYPKTCAVFINKIQTAKNNHEQNEYSPDSKKPWQRYITGHNCFPLVKKYENQRYPQGYHRVTHTHQVSNRMKLLRTIHQKSPPIPNRCSVFSALPLLRWQSAAGLYPCSLFSPEEPIDCIVWTQGP